MQRKQGWGWVESEVTVQRMGSGDLVAQGFIFPMIPASVACNYITSYKKLDGLTTHQHMLLLSLLWRPEAVFKVAPGLGTLQTTQRRVLLPLPGSGRRRPFWAEAASLQ